MPQDDRARPFGAPLLAGLLTATLLVLASSGTPFWKDSGELATAAVDMGVPHPTGFPLWSAVARLFTLLPLGPLHLRISLASALPAALAVGILASLLRVPAPEDDRGRVADLAVRGLLLPFLVLSSPTVWYLSTTPEVYGLATAVAMLTLWWTALARDPERWLVGAGVGAALVPVTHITAGLGLLGALALPMKGRGGELRRAIRRPRTLARVGLTFLLTLGSALALVAAARRNPDLNFGNPDDAAGLLRHLSGQSIREAFAVATTRPTGLEALWTHYRFLLDDIGAVTLAGAALALAGLRRSPVSRVLLAVFLGDLLYDLLINPMGRVDRQTGMLAVLSACALAIIGVREVASRLRRVLPRGIALSSGLLLLAAARIPALAVDLPDRGAIPGDPTALRLGRAALAPLPAGAVAFTTSDDLIGVLLGLRHLEGRRPDVVQVITPYAWWPWRVARLGLGPEPTDRRLAAVIADRARAGWAPDDEGQLEVVRAWLRWATRGRVAVWEPGAAYLDSATGDWLQPGLPWGPVQKDPPDRHSWPDPSEAASEVLLSPGNRHHLSRRAISDGLRLAAVTGTRRGRLPEATRWLEAAVRLDPENGRAWNVLGVLRLRTRDPKGAVRALRRAVARRPHDTLAWRNLGLALRGAGEEAAARHAFGRAKETARSESERRRAESLERGGP